MSEPWLRKVLDDAKAARAEWPAWAKDNRELFLELVRKHALAVEELRLAKSLCTICGEYLPGHATGGADICTCG